MSIQTLIQIDENGFYVNSILIDDEAIADFPLPEGHQLVEDNPSNYIIPEPDPLTPIQLNYKEFWRNLTFTNAYSSIRSQASQSLPLNTLLTEFISIFSDAKIGNIDPEVIQEAIYSVLESVTLTTEELEEIQNIFELYQFTDCYSLFRPTEEQETSA